MVKIRCKVCGKELISTKINETVSCKCPNMATIYNMSSLRITAQDLGQVEVIEGLETSLLTKKKQDAKITSTEDIEWFEKRKTRKVSRSLLNSVEIR
jgi:phage FluMu protein Com